MKNVASKRGSALLVVLGMLAFMVVSAVAFSAYMRASRLPSSYLRRVVSSRMLAKAAMAEAIDEIDAAVGNFPHPGVWLRQNSDGTGMSQSENTQNKLTRTTPIGSSLSESNTHQGHNSNAWVGRVYIGGTDDVASPQARVKNIPQNETVSTLSLEALAYIPPPLVNEARYYSRHSNAGKWHSMPFDAGRYAFCAIDVSDFFDINALTANSSRSSEPDERISLAYLFEDQNHDSAGSTAASWDQFISQQLSTKVPLTSIADWNLAMQGNTFGTVKSYFYQYLSSGNGSFYGGDGTSDESAENIRRMAFVTDGWYPEETTTSSSSSSGDSSSNSTIDLANDDGQPFTEGELKNSNPNYYQITESGSECSQRLLKHISTASLAMLYDYLDEDRIPLSLSLPSVERVPMICGIEPHLDGSMVKVDQALNEENGGNDQYTPEEKPVELTRKARRTIVFRLNESIFGGMPSAKMLVAYPFRHKDGENVTFTVDGGLALFFTSDSMGLRPRSAVQGLRFTEDNKFQNGGIIDNSVMLLPFSQKPQVVFSQVNSASDAVKELDLTAEPNTVAGQLANNDYVLLKVVYEWEQHDTTADRDENHRWQSVDKPDPETEDVIEAFCGIKPLTENGMVDTTFNNTKDALVKAIASKEVRLNLAVYARIKDQNGKTVDMVPACFENDAVNGSSNAKDPQSSTILSDNFGQATPLMRFDTGGNVNTGVGFTWSIAGLTEAATEKQVSLVPTAVMVGDPRYNYAPESWFQASGSLSAQSWLTDNGATGGSAQSERRDGDIFMATSDQNRLQSVYELAFLPRISRRGFFTGGGNTAGNIDSPNKYNNKSFAVKGDNSIINNEFMWRTYDPFMRYDNDDVTFEDLKVVNSGSGLKINPYSNSTNVMMAAFANTPLDWRCASADESVNSTIANLDAKQFNQKYAWNNYSDGGTIDWENLESVARNFMQKMRNANGDDWEDIWRDDLKWYDESKTGEEASKYLLGDQLLETSEKGRLYDTDKKFLYGFWHDCFAPKQQLFLIFVRAEPMLMGGGAIHQSPPQLGSRAVALVWRDPINRSNLDTSTAQPHRTRILFYRQFD